MTDSITPGDEFDWLIAREPIASGKFWQCDCKCGGKTRASKWHLLKGRRRSCRCRKRTPPSEYLCGSCGQTKSRDQYYIRPNGRVLYTRCKPCLKRHLKELERQRRITALTHYSKGDIKCACCGEPHLEFLHLDHVGGWGKDHRKEIKATKKMSIWKWLEKHHYPDLPFQVLCANCNLSISSYGYCPHKH